ncbi:LLM class flavin-dependent oxidoreductase [Streptomyces sp. DSM 41972]|uniref:LLM class flavin-dependent oxidoreductase n=1 Tax=Streptomyces althioticus subsp. attaecolombicae TaxID=3075534 RepID=A0ABU3I4S0_9ACTN|nr:LLM class flavin-dependent oxidoreductase [Streptomyces sp. DSM 41972]SCD31246.1 Flavin-dependent oxidoreductase, luciferase family (includes alkanesulfonate monooxygenase SsuD and methylene tetrahydromethanopterin reductase) [Streptomyces sp. di50b]SCE29424.1 Flavin-dependent oxidoreductase, luciferase family (includes alkanesulfonate monooxygenase SsuD and methylene tetrahydromethanopterin reductase) [Streptomyces sp. di188]
MTAYSVLVPFMPRRPEQILPYAGLVSWTNAERLWQGQALLVEPHQAFTYAAGAGFRVPVGLGVTLTGLRHPLEAALQARSLAMTTGHSVVAGFGPGGRHFQEAVREKAYDKPLRAVREYLVAVRKLLGQDITGVEGEYVTSRAQLPASPAPRVELGLGVLRPGMARLAGELADRAITWLTPADYVKSTIVPSLREGAERAGRAVPRITAMVPMALEDAERDAVRTVLASNQAHLTFPHYIDMLNRAGAGIAEDDGPDVRARKLVDCGGFLYGPPARLAELCAAYTDAGVDEIVINLTGIHGLYGQQAVLDELRVLLGEFTR